MATIDDSTISALSKLRADWPNRAWSWDGRLPTVASSFGAEQAAQARAVAEVALPRWFNSETLVNAPADHIAVIARSGGLRGEQLAFCGGATANNLAFALWWPWGGGKTISVRIGLIGADTDPTLSARLRDLFGVQD